MGIVVPPGVPVIINGLLSFKTIVGVIELNILFPGWMELASPPIAPYIFWRPV